MPASDEIITEGRRHAHRLLAELQVELTQLDADRSLLASDIAQGRVALQNVIESARKVAEELDRD